MLDFSVILVDVVFLFVEFQFESFDFVLNKVVCMKYPENLKIN